MTDLTFGVKKNLAKVHHIIHIQFGLSKVSSEVENFDSPDCKVEKILKGCLESIPSPSPSVKIQITAEKVYLG